MQVLSKRVLLILIFALFQIPNTANANLYPTAHAGWSNAYLTDKQGVAVEITPQIGGHASSWSMYSEPCSPGKISNVICFEVGIIQNQSAWLRLELPSKASEVHWTSWDGSQCSVHDGDYFGDLGTSELNCNRLIPDFKYGQTYTFFLAPLISTPQDEGQWWGAGYINNATKKSFALGNFRYDLSLEMTNAMSRFRLIDQMNWNQNLSDCSQSELSTGTFSPPFIADPYKVGNTPNIKQSIVSQLIFVDSPCTNFQKLVGDKEISVTMGFGGNKPFTLQGLETLNSVNKSLQIPRNFKFSFVDGSALISVEVPGLTANTLNKVLLVSSAFGYTKESPLEGTITGNKVTFILPISNLQLGKKFALSIFNSDGTSVSNSLSVQLPVDKNIKLNAAQNSLTSSKKDSNSSGIQVPPTPTNPNYKLIGNKILVTVNVPAKPNGRPTSAKLSAPNLGISSDNPLIGKIVGNHAEFYVSLTPEVVGKSSQVSISLVNAAGSSAPLSGKVTIPNGVPTNSNSSTSSAGSNSISCLKGSIERQFTGATCPPGWKSK